MLFKTPTALTSTGADVFQDLVQTANRKNINECKDACDLCIVYLFSKWFLLDVILLGLIR